MIWCSEIAENTQILRYPTEWKHFEYGTLLHYHMNVHLNGSYRNLQKTMEEKQLVVLELECSGKVLNPGALVKR